MKTEDNRRMKSVLDSISAPSALKEDLMMKSEFNKRNKLMSVRRLAAISASCALLFGAGNIVTYASSGESLVHVLHVMINGESQPIEMQKMTDEDGNVWFQGHFDGEDGTDVYFATDDEDANNDIQYEIMDTEVEFSGK